MPSTIRSYGSRHAWAHCPRFALRPPHASDEKHCPEYETHNAPCTKISSSTSVCALIARISASDSSRANTTRFAPKRRANSTPAALVTLICVLPCTSRCGAICRANAATPISCTMMASTPASAIAAIARLASDNSCPYTNVLNVTKPRTLRRCNVCMTSWSSSSANPTLARAEKWVNPKYTASAPASTAACNCGQ